MKMIHPLLETGLRKPGFRVNGYRAVLGISNSVTMEEQENIH